MIVGGNVNAGNVQLQAGNARVGGSVNGNINFNGGGSLINDPGVSSEIASMRDVFANASSVYSTYTATGSVNFPGSQPAGVIFNASPNADGTAVFNIDGADLFSNSRVQSIGLNLSGADMVIINVSGTSIDFTSSGNFVGSFANDDARSRVIWNFYEAETIDLRGKGFEGSILATNAFLEHRGVISGSVFVDSMRSESEVHTPGFMGDFPAVPAPGPLFLLGLGGIVACRRRR